MGYSLLSTLVLRHTAHSTQLDLNPEKYKFTILITLSQTLQESRSEVTLCCNGSKPDSGHKYTLPANYVDKKTFTFMLSYMALINLESTVAYIVVCIKQICSCCMLVTYCGLFDAVYISHPSYTNSEAQYGEASLATRRIKLFKLVVRRLVQTLSEK
jgi:hypothetical protein